MDYEAKLATYIAIFLVGLVAVFKNGLVAAVFIALGTGIFSIFCYALGLAVLLGLAGDDYPHY